MKGSYVNKPTDTIGEKERLLKYLEGKFGEGFTVTRYDDRIKTVFVTLDYGDDEIIDVCVNRRNGDNGNYRIVSQG